MKKMNRIRNFAQALVYVGVLSFLFSCSKDEVEIVSQDVSWTIDKKYIEEDIREQLGLDPFNKLAYLGYYNSPLIMMSAYYDMIDVKMDGSDEFSIKVKLTAPFDKDVKVNLMRDEESLKECPVNVAEYTTMSESNFTSEPVVIKAGEIEANFAVKLKNIKDFTQAPGYILPLALKLEGEYEGLKISQVRGSMFLMVKVIIRLDNIDSTDEPIEGDKFNKDVMFMSDIRPKSLVYLNDGLFDNSWYSDKAINYLDAVFSNKVLLKGIMVNTKAGRYCVAKIRVYVDIGNGSWIDAGLFSRTQLTDVAYIKFKKPMESSKVRFQEISPNTADLYEVTFIK